MRLNFFKITAGTKNGSTLQEIRDELVSGPWAHACMIIVEEYFRIVFYCLDTELFDMLDKIAIGIGILFQYMKQQARKIPTKCLPIKLNLHIPGIPDQQFPKSRSKGTQSNEIFDLPFYEIGIDRRIQVAVYLGDALFRDEA